MSKANNNQFVQGSLFEEDYLIRTLGALVHYPEIALTELVANAWDAGGAITAALLISRSLTSLRKPHSV